MGIASDQQMQRFADERLRPRCETIRALLLQIEDDIAVMDGVCAAAAEKKWQDARTDGPPCLMTCDMVLGVNKLLHDLRDLLRGHAELPVMLKTCVRSVVG